MLIGVFAGFYVVPLFAFVQARTPRDRLSRVIAGNNILNALLIVIASCFGLALDTLGFGAPQIFLVAALLNVVVAAYIFTLVPEFLMRFITWILVNTLYRIRVDGMQNLPEEGPALLVCNHVSFMDPLILMANLRRPARFVMYYKIFNIPVLHFVFKTAKAIPIAGQKEDPAVLHKAFEDVDAALADGELVCIFPEGGLTKDGSIAPFRAGVEKILQRRPVPVVPMALRGLWGSVWSRRDSMLGRSRLPRRFRAHVELVVDTLACFGGRRRRAGRACEGFAWRSGVITGWRSGQPASHDDQRHHAQPREQCAQQRIAQATQFVQRIGALFRVAFAAFDIGQNIGAGGSAEKTRVGQVPTIRRCLLMPATPCADYRIPVADQCQREDHQLSRQPVQPIGEVARVVACAAIER